MGERGRKRSITVSDIEKAMGKKADSIGDFTFAPETGSFGRTITFKIDEDTAPQPDSPKE